MWKWIAKRDLAVLQHIAPSKHRPASSPALSSHKTTHLMHNMVNCSIIFTIIERIFSYIGEYSYIQLYSGRDKAKP